VYHCNPVIISVEGSINNFSVMKGAFLAAGGCSLQVIIDTIKRRNVLMKYQLSRIGI